MIKGSAVGLWCLGIDVGCRCLAFRVLGYRALGMGGLGFVVRVWGLGFGI